MLDLFRAKLLGIEPEKFKDFQTLIRGYQLPKGGHHSTIVGSPTSWSWGRAGLSELQFTANKLLKGAGAGADPTETNGFTKSFVVSDNIRNSNDAEKYADSTTYVKKKEIKLNDDLPVVRIHFELMAGAAVTVNGQIYKNGAAIGTEQSTTSTTYVSFNEDLSGFVKDDLIQIYIKIPGGGYSVYVANFSLRYDRKISKFLDDELETPLNLLGISTTNQDPA